MRVTFPSGFGRREDRSSEGECRVHERAGCHPERSEAERGIAIVPVEGRTGYWLLELVTGYWHWLLGRGDGRREPLPSPFCRLLSAICSSLPSALSSGPLPGSLRFLAPLGMTKRHGMTAVRNVLDRWPSP